MQSIEIGIFKPSISKVTIPLITLLISLFLPLRVEATSKVTFDLFQGFPLSFLELNQYRGPCSPNGFYCEKLSFVSIDLFALIFNFIILYLIICLVQLIRKKKGAE